MKLKKAIHSDNKSEKMPLGKLLKRDIVRLLWIIVYASVIFFGATFVVALMPTLFAYLYSACGNIVGLDFTNVSAVDLVFWAMCSLSTGAILVTFVIFGLKKLLNKWTNVIINKHVVIKPETDTVS